MIVECSNCKIEFDKSPTDVKRSKSGKHYCSRSCAAKANNKGVQRNKPITLECKSCGVEFHRGNGHRSKVHCVDCSDDHKNSENYKSLTLEEVRTTGRHPSWAYTRVRHFCRNWNKTLGNNPCQNCGYDKHVEFCHIKPISSYSPDTLLREINHPDNILVLCRNCHWEFDNDMLLLKDIPKRTKQCSKCKETKFLTEFNKDKNRKDGFISQCKSCQKQYLKQYYSANKEKFAEYKKQYRKANKEEISEKRKQYRKGNKEKFAEYSRRYTRKRRANDPAYKLRRRVSISVYKTLKSQKKQKEGSTFEHLPYTPKELKEHIESLWEPWMNWDNWGNASEGRRTWQVDHIIPQSHLIYDSLQHPNFQKCWALSNLRPICAWENLEKGDKLLTEEK